MEETLVKFETAKLAKKKMFQEDSRYCFDINGTSYNVGHNNNIEAETFVYSRPTQSLLQKFIREKRGVHIEIHRNASGYFWSMCRSDGGTDLGWSEHVGPNMGGVWDSFEDALEHALQVQLSYDLPEDKSVIKHWGNYAEFALKNKN